jgi:hypothetical protein
MNTNNDKQSNAEKTVIISGSLDCKVGMYFSETNYLHKEMVNIAIIYKKRHKLERQ